MICCIDSNIFIWGIKRKADPGQENMIDRALHLFKLMDDNKYRIMLPTVVLAEILAPEPLEKHPVIMESIGKNFIIADFNMKSASRYGQLFTNKIEELKKIAKEIDVDNQKMKVDHLIVASALVAGANCIYSHDKGLRVFGQKYIDVKDLPELPAPQLVQKSIFDGYNLKEGSLVKKERDENIPF